MTASLNEDPESLTFFPESVCASALFLIALARFSKDAGRGPSELISLSICSLLNSSSISVGFLRFYMGSCTTTKYIQ